MSTLYWAVCKSCRCCKVHESWSSVVAWHFMISGELSGEEYKKQLINSLCSSRWGHLISKYNYSKWEVSIRVFGDLFQKQTWSWCCICSTPPTYLSLIVDFFLNLDGTQIVLSTWLPCSGMPFDCLAMVYCICINFLLLMILRRFICWNLFSGTDSF